MSDLNPYEPAAFPVTREARAAHEEVAAARPAAVGGKVRKRRVRLPVILFFLTCVSTFWVAAAHWAPAYVLQKSANEGDAVVGVYQAIYGHWHNGLWYMTALIAILLFHEMGHFLAAQRYRIPASLPYFLPLPFTPIGTLGAVIALDGSKADRREIFDIGLAGPIAGLVVAIPVMWIGVSQLDLTEDGFGGLIFDQPLLVRWMLAMIQPTGYEAGEEIWISQINPWFMAGWVGLLVTGLNMMPVSQLDGGHVLYTLFGPRSRWMARLFVLAALAGMVLYSAWIWALMLGIVLLIGVTHPPTRDDSVPLGPIRTALGLASLAIPVLCFPPLGIKFVM